MAPLATRVAATVAASVALGVGVALAKAEHDRRCERERRARRRAFALLAGEPAAPGLQRIALGQLDLTIELLSTARNGGPDEDAVHETRKALKRLRALLRLLESELGAQAFARESAALRDAGRRLSGARDAEVLVSTLDALIERHPRRLARRRGVLELRARLSAERERAEARALGDTATRSEVLIELYALRARVQAWRLSERPAIAMLEPGLRRVYRDGRRRYRRAERGKGERGRALHEWRKRVKDLRYAAEILDTRDESGRGKPGRRRRPRSEEIHELAARADRLGEMLGEEHDLAMLAERVRGRGAAGGGRPGRRTRRILLELIARRRRKLRGRALREGARLYRRPPKRFVARVRRARRRAKLSRR